MLPHSCLQALCCTQLQEVPWDSQGWAAEGGKRGLQPPPQCKRHLCGPAALLCRLCTGVTRQQMTEVRTRPGMAGMLLPWKSPGVWNSKNKSNSKSNDLSHRLRGSWRDFVWGKPHAPSNINPYATSPCLPFPEGLCQQEII